MVIHESKELVQSLTLKASFFHFRLQSWTQASAALSATSAIITGRWCTITAEHEAAIRRPLIWTAMMKSLELL